MENAMLDQAQVIEEQAIHEIEFDADGKPIGYTVEEIFDEIDRELIDRCGEYGRKLANDERAEWNARYSAWHFETL